MAWVKAEYAGELSVVATWLSMLLPWSVAWHTKGPLDSNLAFIRFSVFELQLRFPSQITFEGVPLDVARAIAITYSGVEIFGNFYATLPPAAALEYDGPLAWGNAVWTIAAVVLLIAFAVSLLMYRREEWTVDRLPYPYPRIAGILLGTATALLTIATVLIWFASAKVGTPIPIGILVMGALAFVLLRADIVEDV